MAAFPSAQDGRLVSAPQTRVDSPGRGNAPESPGRGVLADVGRELSLALARLLAWRVRRQFRGATSLCVALGARPAAPGEWCTLGLAAGPGVDWIFDFRKVLPFANGSVRSIVCSEVFEGIDYTEELPYFFAECRRVLEPGGALRIRCRDGARFVRAYCGGDVAGTDELRALTAEAGLPVAGRTRMELVNASLRSGLRRSAIYDQETLESLLRRYGFRTVRPIALPDDSCSVAVEALT